HGPLLAYVEADNRPVALLPTSPRSYRLVDPAARTSQPVTPALAASLALFGYTFYRPLPERPLGVGDLVRYCLGVARGDLVMVLLMGAAVGLLGLATPIATALLFDEVIPGAERDQLWPLALGLVVAALAAAAFRFVSGIAVLRIQGR